MSEEKYKIRIHTSREGKNLLETAMRNFVLDEMGTFPPVDLQTKGAWWENPESKTAKEWKKVRNKMNKKTKKYKRY